MTEQGPVRRIGDQLVGYTRSVTDSMLNDWLANGLVSMDEHIQMRRVIDDCLMQLILSTPQGLAGRALPNPMDMFLFSASGATEVKIGRRISAATRNKLTAAIEAIQSLLEEAAADAAADEENQDEKSTTDIVGVDIQTSTQQRPGITPPTVTAAGPGIAPPTATAAGPDITPPTAKAAGPDTAPLSEYEAELAELEKGLSEFAYKFGGVK
jgi:hypothetical protein